MPHFFCTFCPIPQRQHTINRIIQSILMVPCKHVSKWKQKSPIPRELVTRLHGGRGLPATVSQALLERCRVQKAGNLCGSFIPVATFDAAGWFKQFFSSLVWSPAAWLRQGSSAPRRGTGTSARPKSKEFIPTPLSSYHLQVVLQMWRLLQRPVPQGAPRLVGRPTRGSGESRGEMFKKHESLRKINQGEGSEGGRQRRRCD